MEAYTGADARPRAAESASALRRSTELYLSTPLSPVRTIAMSHSIIHFLIFETQLCYLYHGR